MSKSASDFNLRSLTERIHMDSIYELSWNKASFRAKLDLFLKSRKENRPRMYETNPNPMRASGFSALSSTYYSIASTAYAKLKGSRKGFASVYRLPLWCLLWLPLGGWCYWRMLPLSNRVVDLIRYDGMTPEQCDVRQSILLRRKMFEGARDCIAVALAKNPEKMHTRSLLHIGLAEIELKEHGVLRADTQLETALIQIEKIADENPHQAIRIYRKCAELVDRMGNDSTLKTRGFREKAIAIAKRVGSQNQLLMLKLQTQA